MVQLFDNQIQNCENISSHNVICTLPEHRGVRYTRLPINALLDVVRNDGYSTMQQHIAKSELTRREFVEPQDLPFDIDISLHSVNRLSTKHMHRYLNNCDGQGIVHWLQEKVIECLRSLGTGKTVKQLDGVSAEHSGMTFTFKQHSKVWNRLVLVTVT